MYTSRESMARWLRLRRSRVDRAQGFRGNNNSISEDVELFLLDYLNIIIKPFLERYQRTSVGG